MIELRGLTWARVNIASYTIKTLALVFLLRYLLLASWLPKETQLMLNIGAGIGGSGGKCSHTKISVGTLPPHFTK